MKERGFGSSLWNNMLIRGGISLQQGDYEKARSAFLATEKAAHEMSHRWIELWVLIQLTRITTLTTEERTSFRQRALAILDEMSAHALKKNTNSLFRKFQKGMLQLL